MFKRRSAEANARAKAQPNLVESLENRTLFAVDLTDAVSFAKPTTRKVEPGQQIEYSVTVSNGGTSTADGTLRISLGLSTKSSGKSPLAALVVKKTIDLAAKGSTVIHVLETVPKGFTPAAYYAVATIDSNNAFHESKLTNNTAVSSKTLIVSDPYPDLIGTWSGSGTTISLAGLTNFTDVYDFTTENTTTGAFTGTGTYSISGGASGDLSFTGTISSTGVYAASTTDVPADSNGTTKSKGKLVGTTTLEISYTDGLSSGVLTLTKQS